jgi:predicted acylesterase/phospholipase RssA
MEHLKIGVILIGGSLKGIYGHTGVVAAIRDVGIHPKVILGASAGSIIGSFMAVGLDNKTMMHKMLTLTAPQFLDPISRLDILKEFIINRAKNFRGFIKGDKLEEYIRNGIGDKDDFSKTHIPFYVSATDLKTYKTVLFNTGKISEKVRASCAIPMMFAPKKIGDNYYIDGALRKDYLPKALINVQPDLDYIIVSNFSYEQITDDNSYIDEGAFPMLEIVRRSMAINEKFTFPKKVGKTKIIYLAPGLTQPVDIFHPSAAIARSVFQDSHKYAKYHIESYFKHSKATRKKIEKPIETPQPPQQQPPTAA